MLKGLAEIIASGNGVTAIGAKHIAGGIHANDTLASIALDQNDLRDEGGQALTEAIAENPGQCSILNDTVEASDTSSSTQATVTALCFQSLGCSEVLLLQ